MKLFFFFNDTATTEIYTLSLHDALPICDDDLLHFGGALVDPQRADLPVELLDLHAFGDAEPAVQLHSTVDHALRSEEHTSELQSRQYLVCRLLLEKKNYTTVLHTLRYRP